MSDSLEERLNRHSDSFQGLLSLIPAKYYYDEETQSQWNRKKSSKADKREAKKAKLDPLAGSSAADEAKRRAEAALEEDSDSDLSVIYDDMGNEIRLRPESDDEDQDEPGQPQDAKHDAAKEDAQSKESEEKPKHSKGNKPKLNGNAKEPKEPKLEQKPAESSKKQKQAAKKQQQDKAIKEAGPSEPETEATAPETAEISPEAAAAKAAGIQELRQKLQDRINSLREKRKAPGTTAPGAPKSREELLAVRKQRLEQRKKLKRKRDEKPEEDQQQPEDGRDENIGSDNEEQPDDDIIFGGVNFKDGQKISKDLELAAEKKLKKRSAHDQLKFLEQKKQKIAELDEDKRKEIEEKAKWSRMILQSEGAKLKDNEKLLRKAVKQKKNKKLKSETEWNDRKRKVSEGIADREKKRNQNIANHTLIKQAKGKNQKKKLRQRAGFEGKNRRKN